jgi:hypothetical protein
MDPRPRYTCEGPPGSACHQIPPPCCRQQPASCPSLLRRYFAALDDVPLGGVQPSRDDPPHMPCPLREAPPACHPPQHGSLLLDLLQTWGCWLHQRKARRIAAQQHIGASSREHVSE